MHAHFFMLPSPPFPQINTLERASIRGKTRLPTHEHHDVSQADPLHVHEPLPRQRVSFRLKRRRARAHQGIFVFR